MHSYVTLWKIFSYPLIFITLEENPILRILTRWHVNTGYWHFKDIYEASFCKAKNHFENQIISGSVFRTLNDILHTWVCIKLGKYIDPSCSDSAKLENKGQKITLTTVSSPYPCTDSDASWRYCHCLHLLLTVDKITWTFKNQMCTEKTKHKSFMYMQSYPSSGLNFFLFCLIIYCRQYCPQIRDFLSTLELCPHTSTIPSTLAYTSSDLRTVSWVRSRGVITAPHCSFGQLENRLSFIHWRTSGAKFNAQS